MPNFLKPQSPLKAPNGDYFYPMTTIDQIICHDGTRLEGKGLVTEDRVSNDNLFINPFFQINSNNITSLPSENHYSAICDGWQIHNTTYTQHEDKSITITPTVENYGIRGDVVINDFIGKTVTFSIMLADRSVHSYTFVVGERGYHPNFYGNWCMYINWLGNDYNIWLVTRQPNETITLKGMKLEYGTVSTLANDYMSNFQDDNLRCLGTPLTLEEIQASGNLTNKLASASAVKSLDDKRKWTLVRKYVATTANKYVYTQIPLVFSVPHEVFVTQNYSNACPLGVAITGSNSALPTNANIRYLYEPGTKFPTDEGGSYVSINRTPIIAIPEGTHYVWIKKTHTTTTTEFVDVCYRPL